MEYLMLKSIEVHNFQSWEKTKLTFDPGVNTVIGDSDKGKSAILKALYWNNDNRPLGDSFRSNWGGSTKSIVNYDDCTIQRIKDESTNEYWIDETKLKVLDKECLNDVALRSNINRSINVQAQADPIFLLSKSSGEVAKHFNSIAGLDKIDSTTKAINSKIKQTKADIAQHEVEKEKYTKELESFSFTDKLSIQIQELQESYDKLEDLKQKYQTYQDILLKIDRLSTEIQALKNKYTLYPSVQACIQRINSFESLTHEKEGLQDKYNTILRLKKEIHRSKEKYALKIRVEACVKLTKGEAQYTKKLKQYKKLLNNYENILGDIETLKAKKISKEKELKKKMPDICPLCGK